MGDTRLMLRAAQLYYHGDLTQDAVGKRLGVSRFMLGVILPARPRRGAFIRPGTLSCGLR